MALNKLEKTVSSFVMASTFGARPSGIFGCKIISTLFVCVLLSLTLNSCYSFSGASITPGTKTVSIEYFPNKAALIQPNLSQVFTDELRNYIVSRARLSPVEFDGDVQFSGEIVDYTVTPMAIQSNDVAAQNRLTITVSVIYINKLDEKQNFTQRFSVYKDYDSSLDLSSVEDELINVISKELAENIYQKAFANW